MKRTLGNKINIRIWFLSLGLTILAMPAQAYFHDFTNGVRPSGMGEVFVPVADDANTLIFNPAGLARLVDLEFTGMYSDIYSNLNAGLFIEEHDRLGYNFAALAIPLNAIQGGLGVGWTQFSSIFYTENVFALAYGKRIWEPYMMDLDVTFDLGITGKLLNWFIEENDVVSNPNLYPEYLAKQKTGFTMDAGFLLNLHQEFSMGFNVENILPADMGVTIKEVVPMLCRFGVAYKLLWKDSALYSLLLMLEVAKREEDYIPKFGLESWWWNKILAVRVGVNTERFTSGFSFCYGWLSESMDIQLDYAFSYPFYIAETWGSHRAGLTIRWILPKQELDAEVAKAVETSSAATTAVKSLALAKDEARAAELALGRTKQAVKKKDLSEAEIAAKLAVQRAEKSQLAAKTARALAVEISINLLPCAQKAESAAQHAANMASQAQAVYQQAVREHQKSIQLMRVRIRKMVLKIPERYPNKIIIGIETRLFSEFESLQEILLKTGNLQTYIENSAGMPVEWKFITAPALEMDFKDGELDMFVSYGADMKMYYRNNVIKPVLTAQTHFKDSQQCCLIIRENSDIMQLKDLRGKKIGYSNDKLIAKMKACFFNDIKVFTPANYFKSMTRFKNSKAGFIALQMEDVDVVVEFEFALDIYEKMDMPEGIKVLALSSAKPNIPIFSKLSESVAKNRQMNKIVEALKKYHLEPGAKEVLGQMGIDRFIPYQEQKYKKYLLQD